MWRNGLDPRHAQNLLKQFLSEMGFDGIEYPLMCEIEGDGFVVSAATIWHTDEKGRCLVNSTVSEGLPPRFRPREVMLKYRGVQLKYVVTGVEQSLAESIETRMSGFVYGEFGDVLQEVDSVSILVPNLPSSLSHHRDIETFRKIDGIRSLVQSNSDFGAMILEDGCWKVQLVKIDDTSQSQCDYKAVIEFNRTDEERKSFQDHMEVVNNVALFLSWICGSSRQPAYAFGHDYHRRARAPSCGLILQFDTPSGPDTSVNHWYHGVVVYGVVVGGEEISRLFVQFSALLQKQQVGKYLRSAIGNYTEAYDARTMESAMAHIYAALTAIVRWDRGITRKFNFVKELQQTVVSNGLDSNGWDTLITELEKHRGNALHVQPKWNPDYSSVIKTIQEARELFERLILIKVRGS